MNLRKVGLATLTLGSVLAVLGPATALAADRDDFRGRDVRDRHEYVQNIRRDQDRDHDRGRDDRVVVRPGNIYNTNAYGNGYNAGYNAASQNGYYNQFGTWVPCR